LLSGEGIRSDVQDDRCRSALASEGRASSRQVRHESCRCAGVATDRGARPRPRLSVDDRGRDRRAAGPRRRPRAPLPLDNQSLRRGCLPGRTGLGVRALDAPGLGGGLGGAWGITTEFVLFARRGTLPATGRVVGTWFNVKRPYDRRGKPQHSAKPQHFYDLIERVSPGPYLELFARKERAGWTTWGDELGSGDLQCLA
jgi:hypothetical protein